MYEQEIEVKMRKLPENLMKELLDYVEFLLSKYERREIERKRFNFGWKGGLSEIKEEFSSVELQHKSLEWRYCF